jgi:uncharacterized membrane protein YkoI
MSNGTDEIRDIRQRLEEIEKAIGELHKLVKDLIDYTKGESVKDVTEHVKGEKVDNADQAMEIAHYFFKEKGKTVALPMKAVRQNDVWLVDIDIGAVRLEIATVKIDAKTGDILSHEITQKK